MKKFDFVAATEKNSDQYAGMTNYQYRINDALMAWTAQQYTADFDLHQFNSILEIGCGNGDFWKHVKGQPFQSSIMLTDSSAGMLEECKKTLATTTSIKPKYDVADLDYLPYKQGSYHAILAHKVIYHATNPTKALQTIHAILAPGGVFGMTGIFLTAL